MGLTEIARLHIDNDGRSLRNVRMRVQRRNQSRITFLLHCL